MTTILLADDDILTLNKITGLLNWNEHGYEIIGKAMNGTDCLHLTAQLKPDILILDIDMPGRNGIEVTKILKERNSPVKILILSNYDNFSFVRDALKNNACDYLLKHQIEGPWLLDKLNEIRELLNREGQEKSQYSFLSDMAYREYFRYCLETKPPFPDKFTEKSRRFSSHTSVLGVMQITNFILVTHFSSQMNREKLVHSLLNLSTNVFDTLKNGLMIYMDYGQFAILFRFEHEVSSQKILSEASSHMRLLVSNIQKLFGLTAIWEISDIVQNSERFYPCYHQLVESLEKQPIHSSSREQSANPLDIMTEKAFMDALSHADFVKAEALLEKVLRTEGSFEDVIPQPLIEHLLQIGVRFQQSQHSELLRDKDPRLQSLDFSAMNGQQTREFILDYFRRIMHASVARETLHYSSHVKQTILLIRENYHKDISLSAIAEELNVSGTHLSHLFKKETGVSLIDYLTDFRIERAKLLLQSSDLELKEIAEKTGFRGYNYFLRVYKERTGHTPSQDARK